VDVEGVLYTDSDVDIAVLKLVNEVGIEPVTIGQARDSDKGSIAVAIGSPLGLFNTVSTGIISNFWEANGVNLIQISIPITHGNSGGALFNESGKLIGITSSGIGEANLNFAISSTHIIPICEDIKNIPYNQLNAVPLAVQAAILIPLPGKPDLPIAIKAVLPARVFYLQNTGLLIPINQYPTMQHIPLTYRQYMTWL